MAIHVYYIGLITMIKNPSLIIDEEQHDLWTKWETNQVIGGQNGERTKRKRTKW